jgi:putative transposase
MGRLRHQEFPGATYFVSTKCWQNHSIFQVAESAEILIRKMLEYRDKGNYLLHEFVVMPDHLHILITPDNSTSLERAMQLIKGGSSHEIHKVRGSTASIWQSGFHESRVRDAADYKKRDYIHFNPVAAKLVERPEQWRYSSASGNYELDPIPQRLKPLLEQFLHVGAKAPTSSPKKQVFKIGAKAPSPEKQVSKIETKAPSSAAQTQGLKPLPPKEKALAANLQVRGKSGA